jgi:hypothetical protein
MVKRTDVNTRPLVLLPFSAHDEQSLKMNITAISQAIDRHSLADVAYTLSSGRSKLMHRSFRIIDRQELTDGLNIEQRIFQAPSNLAKIAFVFTGQGAQWHTSKSTLPGFRFLFFSHNFPPLLVVLGYMKAVANRRISGFTTHRIPRLSNRHRVLGLRAWHLAEWPKLEDR